MSRKADRRGRAAGTAGPFRRAKGRSSRPAPTGTRRMANPRSPPGPPECRPTPALESPSSWARSPLLGASEAPWEPPLRRLQAAPPPSRGIQSARVEPAPLPTGQIGPGRRAPPAALRNPRAPLREWRREPQAARPGSQADSERARRMDWRSDRGTPVRPRGERTAPVQSPVHRAERGACCGPP